MKVFLRSQMRRLSCLVRPRTLVLAYHHVRPPGRTSPYVTTPPEQFAEQMEYLVRRRLLAPLDRLLADLRAGRLGGGGRVVVTFDDACGDTWEIAYPILRRLGASATVFVPTGLVGRSRPFWWDRLHLLSRAALDRGTDPRPALAESAREAGLPHPDGEPWKVLRWLDDDRRDRVLERTAARLGVEPPSDGPAAMTWEQVADLDRSGLFTLGAHTVSHPALAGLDEERLAAEAVGAREALSRFASFRPVFAYPYGDAEAVGERVRRAVRDAGFHFGFTTDPGPVRGTEDRMALGRVCVDDMDRDEFRWMIDHHLRA